MTRDLGATDIATHRDGFVTVVEIRRPPHNFFSIDLIRSLADIFAALDTDPECRCILLAAQGTSFCAGADFSGRERSAVPAQQQKSNLLYDEAVRLFLCLKPVVAAVHGPAIGGGLGLAVMADFRVTCPEARESAEQGWRYMTEDFKEGIAAMSERRAPQFKGK
ncbi:MAG: enoyl-CoA hydratase/isomerase family protein [Betaproteobacteria bacterium]|nr:enoyl-CoA hydratase/isomerase family protein [Betaproteobacteria bacterium]